MSEQLYLLNKELTSTSVIDSVFSTHKHIGGYTGLIHFGREAMGSKNMPVYAMLKMDKFLKNKRCKESISKLTEYKVKVDKGKSCNYAFAKAKNNSIPNAA